VFQHNRKAVSLQQTRQRRDATANTAPDCSPNRSTRAKFIFGLIWGLTLPSLVISSAVSIDSLDVFPGSELIHRLPGALKVIR
jgi:hypothetical protein